MNRNIYVNAVESILESIQSTQPTEFSRLITRMRGYTPPHRVIASGINKGELAELCLVYGTERNEDPTFWYMTRRGDKVIMGQTGLVQSYEQCNTEGNLNTIIERSNGYGHFRSDKEELSLGDEKLKIELDRIYNAISQLTFYEEDKRDLFEWRSDQVIARFGEFGKFFDDDQIIPEYNDTMVVLTASQGCFGNCIGCPEKGGKYFASNIEQLYEKLERARRVVEKYHGNHMSSMNEGFINASDILLNYFTSQKNTNIPDPITIVKAFYDLFPEIQKMYGFVGTPTVNSTPEHYLKTLHESGLNRVLIGIETAHDATSAFLGKPFSTEQKGKAIRKLQEAGFRKIKGIVMVGATGQGFYDDNGKFQSSWDALEETAEFMKQNMRSLMFKERADKVIISRYVKAEGTELKKLHEEGKVVVPFSSESELEKQVQWLVSEMRKAQIDVEAGYEVALEKRRRLVA
jgi:hypothetical protein